MTSTMAERKHPVKRSKRRDEKFFQALRDGNGPTKAAPIAGYSVPAVYQWRKQDPEFAQMWAVCDEIGIEVQLGRIEAEIDRRAIDGVDEPVYYKGRKISSIKKYSDTLLMFRAKKLDPTYRDSVNLNHSGAVQGVMVVPGCTNIDEWEKASQEQHSESLGE